jgi:GntR family transcriptional regulator, transcriptional repressor for pyruvate dehydrogenase complex
MLEPVVAPQTITGQAQDKLIRYISDAGLQADDLLPSEAELSSALGVGRSTVREALKSLEAMGIVARKRGCRTVLQDVDFRCMARSAQPLLLRDADDLYQLIVARQMHEMSILPLVIEHAAQKDLESMEYANNMWLAELDAGRAGWEWDFEFHQALVCAAHNKFLEQIHGILREFFGIMGGYFDVKVLAGTVTREEAAIGLGNHFRIVDLLRSGDLGGLQAEMTDHLRTYTRSHIDKVFRIWLENAMA